MQDTRTGTVIRVMLGRGAHVGCLDLLGVNDEQGGGVRRLVFLMARWNGSSACRVSGGHDAPGVTGAKLVLEVERYLKAIGGHLPDCVRCDGVIAPVVGPV